MTVQPSTSRARRWWGETWRVLICLLISATAIGVMAGAGESGYEPGSDWYFAELIGGLAALVLLRFRRWRPVPIATAACALSAVAITATAPAAICFISVATRRRTRDIALVSAAWICSAVGYEFAHPSMNPSFGDRLSSIAITVLTLAFCVAVGNAIGARRELLANLRQQVATAHEQQHARVQQAQLAERARIAREMHDVLAHRMSLVALHAGALAYRADLPPAQVRDTAALIRDSSRLALSELREVLGVLRDDSSAAIEPPQPNLGSVRSLVEATPVADGTVDLKLDGDLEDVPESLSRNAFRIIQEAVTNRRKHALGVPLVIVVRRTDDRLEVGASNSLDPSSADSDLPTSGLGLMGLAERVSLAGGRMTYGIDRSRRFTLTASMPLAGPDEQERG